MPDPAVEVERVALAELHHLPCLEVHPDRAAEHVDELLALVPREVLRAFDAARVKKVGPRDMLLANHLITLDGRVIGGWRRPKSQLELTLVAKLDAAEKKALKAAEQRLVGFLGS